LGVVEDILNLVSPSSEEDEEEERVPKKEKKAGNEAEFELLVNSRGEKMYYVNMATGESSFSCPEE
jgi:hypothetical protein